MSSPKKSSPSVTPQPSRSSLRPFSRRKSSEGRRRSVDLLHEVEELRAQLAEKTQQEEFALERARRAEESEDRMKDLAKRFWKEEWSGMKDYIRLFNNKGAEMDIEEIEERIVSEYGGLFDGKEKDGASVTSEGDDL